METDDPREGGGARPEVPLRELAPLIRARANQADEVVVLIAAREGRLHEALALVEELGGAFVRRFDYLDYARVRLPIGAYRTLRESPAVAEVTVDGRGQTFEADLGVRPLHWPRKGKPARSMIAPAAPVGDREAEELTADRLARTPAILPTADMGADRFRAAHPTFDGRGVTIAVVEGMLDATHEVLRDALAVDGNPVTKISRFCTPWDAIAGVTNPEEMARELAGLEEGHQALRFDHDVVAVPEFDHGGRRYIAPRPGSFRFLATDPDMAIDGESRRPSPSAALWDLATGEIWFDMLGTGDFGSTQLIRDVGVAGQCVNLTAAAGMEPGDDRIVTVRLHPSLRLVTLHAVVDHTMGMASCIAGHGFLGGDTHGVAPAARLVSFDMMHGGMNRHRLVEAYAWAASMPDVDVIASSMWSDSYPNDGGSFTALMAARIRHRTGKMIVNGVSNAGPGLSTHMDLAASAGVLSVGASVHGDTLNLFAYDHPLPSVQQVASFSSRGPGMAGDLAPQVLAPGMTLMAAASRRSAAARSLDGLTLPEHYVFGYGTSFAGPMAAGAVALLISAAKQSGVAHDADRITSALLSSARYLDNAGAHEQGAGLIDVAAAWEVLQAMDTIVTATTSAPVSHAAASRLRVPGRGGGLYERGGWNVGSVGTRRVEIRRTDVLPEDRECRVVLLGNDGTFSVPETAVLVAAPGRTAIDLQVAPQTPGVHSAALAVLDADVVVAMTLLTVVVSHEPGLNGAVRGSGALSFDQVSTFIDVPERTGSWTVALEVEGDVEVRVIEPTNSQQAVPVSPVRRRLESVEQSEPAPGRRSVTHVITDPSPGQWEVAVFESVVSGPSGANFELAASVEPDAQTAAPQTESWDAHQHKATAFDPVVIDVDIPTGTDRFEVAVEAPVPTALLVYVNEDGIHEIATNGDFPTLRPVMSLSESCTPHVCLDRPAGGTHRVVVVPLTESAVALSVRHQVQARRTA